MKSIIRKLQLDVVVVALAIGLAWQAAAQPSQEFKPAAVPPAAIQASPTAPAIEEDALKVAPVAVPRVISGAAASIPGVPGSPAVPVRVATQPSDAYDLAVTGRTPPAQHGSSVLIVRFSEPDPQAQREMDEDLNVMAHLFERNLERFVGSHFPEFKMGVPILLHAPSGRSVQGLYIEGFGALFTLSVNFPLVAPPEEPVSEREESVKEDDWEAARRDLYGRRLSPGSTDGRTPGLSNPYDQALYRSMANLPRLDKSFQAVQYDETRVAALRREILTALRNAANIRHLQADDFVAITVLGSPGEVLLSRDKARFGIVTSVDRRTNRATIEMPDKKQIAVVPVSEIQRSQGRSVLTIRVKKSDVDALAEGTLAPEEFEKRTTIRTYRTREPETKLESGAHPFTPYGRSSVDRATGEEKWESATDDTGWRRSGTIGTDGTVYVVVKALDGNGRIEALDGATGRRKWTFETGLPAHTIDSPSIGPDGTLYVTSTVGYNSPIGLDGKTGRLKR